MKLAAKFRLPIICLIDTPVPYPGIGAEERGQASSIAVNLRELSLLRTPMVCVVIGEGGSGGALGIGVGDHVAMLQFAYYSVISPEGCAGILWKDGRRADQAARALKFTSADLLRMQIVDEVIREPLGGAHRDHRWMANTLKDSLQRAAAEAVGDPNRNAPVATLPEVSQVRGVRGAGNRNGSGEECRAGKQLRLRQELRKEQRPRQRKVKRGLVADSRRCGNVR